jgi:hypothetical protein
MNKDGVQSLSVYDFVCKVCLKLSCTPKFSAVTQNNVRCHRIASKHNKVVFSDRSAMQQLYLF